EEFYFLLRKCLGSHDEVIRVSEAIIDGLPSFKSIDDFLYTHSHDENIKLAGKMAIACVIAEAERNGPLYHLSEPQRDVRRRIQDEIRATWAGSLLQLL